MVEMSRGRPDLLSRLGKSFAAAGTEEHFIVIQPEGRGNFASQVDRLIELYEEALLGRGLADDSGVAATIFLSDAANQEEWLRRQPAFHRLTAAMAVGVIEQAPAGGAKCALLAYHVQRPAGLWKAKLPVGAAKPVADGLAVTAGGYRYIYLKNLLWPAGGPAGAQSEGLFAHIDGQAGGLRWDEVIRTWIYVDRIDAHYKEVSEGRNRVFDRLGLSPRTGYPASTGIEGRTADHSDLVAIDVLAIQGLQPGQTRRMEALSHMNPTVEYGVQFERGREVIFGDRRHLYLSGTASINTRGQILYPSDVVRQAERAIDNMNALLEASRGSLADLVYALVYLRDLGDLAEVEAVIADSPLCDVPHLVVHAPICRPGWLVEFEGMAIDAKGDPRFAHF